MIFLVGALTHPVLRMRLAPGAVEVEGLPGHALQGGQGAGIAPDGWPALVPAQGRVPLWRTDWTPALTRYAHIFGLEPVAVAGRDILGVAARAREGAGRWDPELAAALADHLLALPPDRPAGAVRARLPLIAAWVASTLRAARDSRDLPALGPAGDDRLQVLAVEEPYAEFFSVQEITLRHRRHRGGWTPEVLRAVFVSGDAAVVLSLKENNEESRLKREVAQATKMQAVGQLADRLHLRRLCDFAFQPRFLVVFLEAQHHRRIARDEDRAQHLGRPAAPVPAVAQGDFLD